MVEISGTEYIDFGQEDVFNAGIRAEVWPSVDGLLLQPKEEILALGGLMAVGLTIQAFRIGLPGAVTIFEYGRAIVIEGENKMAAARIAFSLIDNKNDSETQVDYKLTLKPKNLATKLAEPSVRRFVAAAVPNFTTDYRKNVTKFLLNKTT